MEELFPELRKDIDHQRTLLKQHDVEEFDCAWGLDPTGEFAQARHVVSGRHGAAEEIKKVIIYVQQQTSLKVKKLELIDDDHIGLEILHLFILDLLGRDTNAAKIFESKTGALRWSVHGAGRSSNSQSLTVDDGNQ